ncbi:3-beta hydroxysteroid dehydrogenase [Kitasatospora sp. MMS16-BH015]|uniref:NAD-dependent epimerase/dehydratase family protein n=1 Tax=Kitasatospora sp. MMS16-BH015 TaxID=2018025 RepID=UPI000CA10D9C|nr:NAD-dependent epimerase/dehydratase family protein [Kitasatospora sp. MMS16-BH015]AUG81616.1 3-beta hydroxysteroid dehydrogenase [Kitasatospora sp. MMS16-BH015]
MKVLVTGGSGFLGTAICHRLLAAGHQVRSLSRRPSPTLPATVDQRPGDITDPGALDSAVQGCDAVVHTAALAAIWGSRSAFHDTNVRGTDHVIAACLRHHVPRLVHTSTASVVFGATDLTGADESTPYPARHLAAYPWSKALAERAVLAANCPALATVALRVHLVWGPGDPHFLPRLLHSARRGTLTLVGDGTSTVDTLHIDNAARAHLDALDRLTPGSPAAGNAYFITQDEPVPLADMARALLATTGRPVRIRHLPLRTAMPIASAAEQLWRLGRLRGAPPLTRFLAAELAASHWFDITAARRDLGYRPEVTTAAGLEHLARTFAHGPPAA